MPLVRPTAVMLGHAASASGVATKTSVNGAADAVFTALATIPVPRLGANSRMRVAASWAFTSSASTKRPVVMLGSDILLTVNLTTTATYGLVFDIQNGGVTNVQVAGRSGASSAGLSTGTTDTSAPSSLYIGGNWSAAATADEIIRLMSYAVDLYP
jgi:hypothetical protein